MSSWKLVLPPSMMISPADSKAAALLTVSSVGGPEGTMIQTARGAFNMETMSSSEIAPTQPTFSACFTRSVVRS